MNSGVQEEYRDIIPSGLLSIQNYVFPASCYTTAGTSINIRSSGDSTNTVWFAPSGITNFVEGPNMTKAVGNVTIIAVPATAGIYKLYVLNSQGTKLGESDAQLRVSDSGVTPGSGGLYIRLRNVATGLYIDGMGSVSNGSNACQWNDSKSDNQQWTIINSGDYVIIQNRATGLYLDGMGSTTNGSNLCQWGNSGSTNQQWQIQ